MLFASKQLLGDFIKIVDYFLLFLKLCGAWIVSWLIGCFVNAFKCLLTAGDYAGDCAIQTAFFSFIILTPFFLILYLPAMFGLRKLLGGAEPKVVFPIVSSILFVIPLGFIYLSITSTFGQLLEVLFDPTGEFQVVSFVTGLFFGIGFVLLLAKRDAGQSEAKDDGSKLHLS